jgi:hypothetical protein
VKVQPCRFQPLTTPSFSFRTCSFHFIEADAVALQLTEPWPVMKFWGFCFVS